MISTKYHQIQLVQKICWPRLHELLLATAASECHQIQLLQKILTVAQIKCSWPCYLRNGIKCSSYKKCRLRLQRNAVGHGSFEMASNAAPTKNIDRSSNKMQSVAQLQNGIKCSSYKKCRLIFSFVGGSWTHPRTDLRLHSKWPKLWPKDWPKVWH